MRVFAVLAFVALLSCATAAAASPKSLVRSKRLVPLDSVLRPVFNIGGSVLSPVVNTVTGLVGTVTGVIDELLDLIGGLVSTLAGLLGQFEALQPLASSLNQLVPTIQNALNSLQLGNSLNSALGPVIVQVATLVDGVLESGANLGIPVVSDILGQLGRIFDSAFQLFAQVIFRQLLRSLRNTI